MFKCLIASPVKQKPAKLREFLDSLDKLDTAGIGVGYVFVDDNDNPESSAMLKQFQQNHSQVTSILTGWITSGYVCDEEAHHWDNTLFAKITEYREKLLDEVRNNNHWDYIFMVDSDLVLHPATLRHLISLQKDIVAEVFQTRWYPAPRIETWANVWEKQPCLSSPEFLERITHPGTYKVGGLGACTLISREALQAGVSYRPLPNVDFNGEDRYFCVRAAALGFDLWADTHYPPFHNYRESELAYLPVWKDRQRERGCRITVGMLVHNEAGRYLQRVLEQVKQFADNIVILDDASTDDTGSLCCKMLGATIAYNASGDCMKSISTNGRAMYAYNFKPGFHSEITLRKQLWDLCVDTGNDWIMIMDADEVWEDRCIEELPRLAANPAAEAYAFRRYDMWDESHYRSDNPWNAHTRYGGDSMHRYIPGYAYTWNEQPLHCGRYPNNWGLMNVLTSDLRLKHLGWSKPEDRQRKYDWYKQYDPDSKWGVLAQYASILDPSPYLVEWHEDEKKKLENPTVSLCMIVKDEEANLRRCLESVKDVVDEIVIVDTGSTDSTLAIVQKCADTWENKQGRFTLVHRTWNDDFSKARNEALDWAHGDWILFLDADEELPPASSDLLRSLIASDMEGHYSTIVNKLPAGENRDLVFRLFRNRGYRFTGAAHEQILESIARTGLPLGMSTEFEIIHHGYQENQQKKIARNIAVFEQSPPADPLGHYHYANDLMRAGRWGDAITEFIAASKGIHSREFFYPKLIRGLVTCWYEMHWWDYAIDVVRLGTMLFPDYADLYYFAGLIRYEQRETVDDAYAEAAWWFRRVLECPDPQPIHYASLNPRESAAAYLQSLGRQHDLDGLEPHNLLPLYLCLWQNGSRPMDITLSDGQVFKGVSVGGLRKEIGWRCLGGGSDRGMTDKPYLKYSTPEREELCNRDTETLVGWQEGYPYIADCHQVLDIGCGVGNGVGWLQQRGHYARGITYQESELGVAIANGMRGVHLADMHDIPYSDKAFDAFIMWDSLEHAISPLAALLEAKRVLRPGGKGLIFIPAQKWIEYGPHVIVPTIRQMVWLLRLAGLEIVEVVTTGEGDGWDGNQAVYKIKKEG